MTGSVRARRLGLWLFTCAVIVALTLPVLVQDGMFMDAVLYTSVAHNLSQGIGSFWFPQFSAHNIAGLSAFHEQPPLVFGIQAVFFNFLGSSIYVERFYTLLMLVITVLLMARLWETLCPSDSSRKDLSWLPALLWITIPVCFWSYRNNMHENTMGVFCLLAVLFTIQGLQNSARWKLAAAAFCIFLATLSKGVPGLFPLALPVLYTLILGKISLKKALAATVILAAVPLICYGILFLIPESRESLSAYFFERALHRINEAPTVDNRFHIFGRLVMELLPQLILILLLALSGSKIKAVPNFRSRPAWMMIATGLAGSLPLMLTMVQKSFYLVPALPYFAVGTALLIAPAAKQLLRLLEPFSNRVLFLTGIIAVIISLTITLSKAGNVSRNAELLHDVYTMGKIMPQRSTVSIPPELWNEWDLQCYLMRHYHISLEKSENQQFYLTRKSFATPPESYQPVNVQLIQHDLYRKKANRSAEQ